MEVSLPSCRGCLSPFVKGFFVHFMWFFFFFFVGCWYSRSGAVDSDLDSWCFFLVRSNACVLFKIRLFCFLGSRSAIFFTQIRILCCSSVVPPAILRLFQTWPNVVVSLTQAWYQSRCCVQIVVYRPMAPATASCYSSPAAVLSLFSLFVLSFVVWLCNVFFLFLLV